MGTTVVCTICAFLLGLWIGYESALSRAEEEARSRLLVQLTVVAQATKCQLEQVQAQLDGVNVGKEDRYV